MFITYIAHWLYTVMQLPVPIVLSPTHIYSITIFNLFIGVLLFGIFMMLIERAMNGLRFSDFRIKEKVPETIEINNSSNSLTGVDNMGRKRFSGKGFRSKSSIAQRIIKNKDKYNANLIDTNKNIGVRLTENKIKERDNTYESLIDYKMKKIMRKDDEE